MKKALEKTVPGLVQVLDRMTQRMQLAHYAESTIRCYTRSVRIMDYV